MCVLFIPEPAQMTEPAILAGFVASIGALPIALPIPADRMVQG